MVNQSAAVETWEYSFSLVPESVNFENGASSQLVTVNSVRQRYINGVKNGVPQAVEWNFAPPAEESGFSIIAKGSAQIEVSVTANPAAVSRNLTCEFTQQFSGEKRALKMYQKPADNVGSILFRSGGYSARACVFAKGSDPIDENILESAFISDIVGETVSLNNALSTANYVGVECTEFADGWFGDNWFDIRCFTGGIELKINSITVSSPSQIEVTQVSDGDDEWWQIYMLEFGRDWTDNPVELRINLATSPTKQVVMKVYANKFNG